MNIQRHLLYYVQPFCLMSVLPWMLIKPSIAQAFSNPSPLWLFSSTQQGLFTHSSNRHQEIKTPLIPSESKVVTQEQNASAFQQWLSRQDPHTLLEYQGYIQQHVKRVPSLMALTQYPAVLPQRCGQLRFAIPKKQQWKSIVLSLELLEKLHAQGMIQPYQVLAVRGFDAERCLVPELRNYDRSRPALGYGVYFKLKPQDQRPQPLSDSVLQALCQFWTIEGKHYRMGMTLYPEQTVYLHRNAYQSWGKSPYSTVECHSAVQPTKLSYLLKN